MPSRRIFDLEKRVPRKDPFTEPQMCRDYDLSTRTSMIIPAQHVMKLLAPLCRPDARILEVNAGPGIVSLRLAALFPRCDFMATESSDAFLAVMRENLIFANLLHYGGSFRCEWARPFRLPMDDASMDVVFSFCALHRFERAADALRECHRVCKPDGTVILYDLARDAEEGLISFILQYAGADHQEFMGALRASFSVPEMTELLAGAGLSHWCAAREGINLIVTSRPMDVSFTVGEPGIYDNIFMPAYAGPASS